MVRTCLYSVKRPNRVRGAVPKTVDSRKMDQALETSVSRPLYVELNVRPSPTWTRFLGLRLSVALSQDCFSFALRCIDTELKF